MTTKVSQENDLCDAIEKALTIALFSHVSPDGDTLGSMLAIGAALEKAGKKIFYYCEDSVPKNLLFLPGAERIQNFMPNEWPEMLLFIDCAELKRSGFQPEDIPGHCVVLNLDHHISNTYFGKFNWVDVTAGATGELAYDLIQNLGIDFDAEIATNLYTAIITDTGSFQYSNTRSKTHRITAGLLDQGIDLVQIHHSIYNQNPLPQLRLLSRAINSLKLYHDGKMAVMSLAKKDFAECQADQEMSEGLINHARTIAGVEIAAMLREVDGHMVKVSLRSNLWFNVNELAALFSGGGHYRAAGCKVEGTLKQVEEKLVKAVGNEIKK